MVGCHDGQGRWESEEGVGRVERGVRKVERGVRRVKRGVWGSREGAVLVDAVDEAGPPYIYFWPDGRKSAVAGIRPPGPGENVQNHKPCLRPETG